MPRGVGSIGEIQVCGWISLENNKAGVGARGKRTKTNMGVVGGHHFLNFPCSRTGLTWHLELSVLGKPVLLFGKVDFQRGVTEPKPYKKSLLTMPIFASNC